MKKILSSAAACARDRRWFSIAGIRRIFVWISETWKIYFANGSWKKPAALLAFCLSILPAFLRFLVVLNDTYKEQNYRKLFPFLK